MTDVSQESPNPTPYATICHGDKGVDHKGCGRVFMTKEAYLAQMASAWNTWVCVRCGYPAGFDDETFEDACDAEKLRKEAQ